MTEATSGTEAPAARSVQIVLPLPKPLLTTNARDDMHWRQRVSHVASQRTAAKMHAMQQLGTDFAPLVGRVRLDATVCPYPRQKEPDEGGKWQAVKPWEDGLQDAGVFAGGDDKVVVYGKFAWCKDRRVGEVVLTLTEVSE